MKWLCWCQAGWCAGFFYFLFTYNHLEFTENCLNKKKISSNQQLCQQKCLTDVKCQRESGRLIQHYKKATVVQTTAAYNKGIPNTVSEHVNPWSTRKPYRLPLPSAKERTLWLHFPQWTVTEWKNIAWSDECWGTLVQIVCLRAAAQVNFVVDTVHPFKTTDPNFL